MNIERGVVGRFRAQFNCIPIYPSSNLQPDFLMRKGFQRFAPVGSAMHSNAKKLIPAVIEISHLIKPPSPL